MRYSCDLCGWIYDEQKEGTPFDKLPDDYVCPICGADKEMFSKVEN